MNPEIVYVQGPAHLGRLGLAAKRLKTSSGPLGVDTETTGLDALTCQVRLLQLGIPGYALVIDLDGWRQEGHRQVPWDAQGLRLVKQLLCGNRMKVLQNAAFDLNFLWAEGIELGGEIFDTMFASQVKNNGNPNAKNNLGAIVKRVLHVELPKELQKADWAKELTPEMVEYAGRDATCLPLLQDRQVQALKETKLSSNTSIEHVYQLEQDVLPAVARMQHWGFKFDVAAAEALKQELSATAEQLKLEFCELLDARLMRKHPEDDSKWLPRDPDGSLNLREKNRGRGKNKVLAGFNPRSVKQLKDRLQDAGVRLRPNEKGEPCLDQNLLAYLRSSEELIDKYLTYKASVTRVSHVETLLDAVGPDGRIHAGYKQMGTQTGRLSCARPNLQQVPRTSDFRSLFVAEPGWKLVVADFSQIELRVAAEMSKEERMIDAYRDGRDLHTETAALIAKVPLEEVTKSMRTSAKLCNFGLLYGAGPATLRKQAIAQYGIDMSPSEAKELVDGFREAYPTLYQWQQDHGTQTTEAVMTMYGRLRYLYGFDDKYTTRINTVVQGSAGDIAKMSIKLLWDELQKQTELEAKLIAMVHDEIVLEVKEGVVEYWQTVLSKCMRDAGAHLCKTVPIEVGMDCGDTWADAK